MKKFSVVMTLILSISLCLLPVTYGCKKKSNVIRVNEVTHSIFYAPLYVAINNGYFAEENI